MVHLSLPRDPQSGSLMLTGALAGALVIMEFDVRLEENAVEVVITDPDHPDDPILLTGNLADFPLLAHLATTRACARSASAAPPSAASAHPRR